MTRPESIAAKIAAVRDNSNLDLAEQFLDSPRLRKWCWYFDARCRQPGGKSAYIKNLVSKNIGQIGTKTMRAIADKKEPWNLEERRAVCAEMPQGIYNCHHFLWTFQGDRYPRDRALDPAKTGFEKFNREYFTKGLMEMATDELSIRLVEFVEIPEKRLVAPWYFPTLIEALIADMDDYANAIIKKIAITKVQQKVFKEINYAIRQKAFVQIEAPARQGKSVSGRTFSDAFPGESVFIPVPPSNNITDLLRRVAESHGMDFPPSASPREIKARIEYVIRHGRRCVIFDEAHWLWPQKFTANTVPARLNWVRSELIDWGIPVVLLTTPQSYKWTERYAEVSKYNFKQWDGRRMLHVKLQESLDKEDLIAVARHLLPDFQEAALKRIAAKAMLCGGDLPVIEAVAKRLRDMAGESNERPVIITLTDVETAFADIIPPPAPPPAVKVLPPPAQVETTHPVAVRRPRPIRASQPAATPAAEALEAPARSITPETLAAEHV